MGVTVRELNGWAPTVVVCDLGGKPIGAEVAQPRFTAREKNLLLASRRVEKRRGKHGVLMTEATNPKNQGKYSVRMPTMDYAEAALLAAQKQYHEKYPNAEMGALLWRVEKFDATAK